MNYLKPKSYQFHIEFLLLELPIQNIHPNTLHKGYLPKVI